MTRQREISLTFLKIALRHNNFVFVVKAHNDIDTMPPS